MFFYLLVVLIGIISEQNLWLLERGLDLLKFIGINHYGWFLVGIYFYSYWRHGGSRSMMASFLFGSLAVLDMAREENISAVVMSVIILTIFWFSFLNQSISKIFSHRLFTLLGFISYPLYLVHQNFVTGFAIAIYRVNDSLFSWLYPIIPMTVALAISYALAKTEPLLKQVLSNRFKFASSLQFG